ncbi:MAG TPA: energy transducer TonB [Pyrinomonadaceae bacterium]|nr:energy transducer TonB [Pyrinomonadaceae bacterium]
MKLHLIGLPCFFAALLAGAAVGQVGPADSDPVMQGSATYVMPQSAVDAKIGGSVMVAVRVDETGKPVDAAVIWGPAWPCDVTPLKALGDLSSTLSEAMLKLRFIPARKNGKPVARNVGVKVELKNPSLPPHPSDIDPATGKPKYKQIMGGVLNGKAISLPKPAYPSEARANRDAGTVTIQILIDETGKVVQAGAVSGAPTLQFAAREAACHSKFSPTTLAGNPVKVSGVITYNFVP